MSSQFRTSMIESARLLGDYQHMSIDQLANGYNMATAQKHVGKRSAYISALVLRFWNRVEMIYQKCQTVPDFTRDDAALKLFECIKKACEDHEWTNPAKNLNAEQCINQVIVTRGAPAILYESNLQKNKINFGVASLEEPQGTEDDSEISLMDTIADDYSSVEQYYDAAVAVDFVQSFINQNKIIEAIILDAIAFNNLNKNVKHVIKKISSTDEAEKYTQVSQVFSSSMCVDLLSALPENYIEYFSSRYNVSPTILRAGIDRVQQSKRVKLSQYVRKTLLAAQKSPMMANAIPSRVEA